MKVIAIMRPAGYLAESAKLARSMGFETITAPMIDVVDKKDPEFNVFANRILEGEADHVIFTSANGVEFTLLKLNMVDDFIRQLNHTSVVAIGPKTKNALIKNGIRVSIIPKSYSSEGIVEMLVGIEGSIIEIARSSHGTPKLVRGLIEKGAVVHETQVYQIISPRDERHRKLMEHALAGEIDIFAFTSSMIVRNFIALADEIKRKDDIISILNEKTVASIGKPTADTLSGYGINVKIMPVKYTFEDLLKECKDKV